MPSPGSLVRLKDGRIALITKVTPKGNDDRVFALMGRVEERATAWDINEVIHETS